MPAPFKTEVIVLRSIRYGEADRILHLYSLDHGRLGAIAKGVRRGEAAVRAAGRYSEGGAAGEVAARRGARAVRAREPDPAAGARRPLHRDRGRHRARAPGAARAALVARTGHAGVRRRAPAARLERAESPGVQPAGARAGFSRCRPGCRGALPGADLPA